MVVVVVVVGMVVVVVVVGMVVVVVVVGVAVADTLICKSLWLISILLYYSNLIINITIITNIIIIIL